MSDWPETDALLERFRTWLDQVREESRAPARSPSPRGVGRRRSGAADDGAAERAWTRRSGPRVHGPAARGQIADQERPGAGRTDRRGHRRDGGGRPAVPRRRAARGRGGPAGGLALDRIAGRSRRGPGKGPGRGGIGPPAAATSRRPLFPGSLPTWMRPSLAWKRWLCHSWYAAARKLCQADAEDRKRVVDALADGYDMVRKRLQRAMAKEGLYRMASRRPAGRSARHDRGRGGR